MLYSCCQCYCNYNSMLNCCTVVVVVAVAVVVVVVVVTTILCESCCCDYSCICKCCTVVCCCYCCCCVRYRCCCLVCFVVFFIVVVVSCVVVFFIAVVVSLSFWGLAMRDFVDLVDFSQKTKALSHSPSLSIPLSLSCCSWESGTLWLVFNRGPLRRGKSELPRLAGGRAEGWDCRPHYHVLLGNRVNIGWLLLCVFPADGVRVA